MVRRKYSDETKAAVMAALLAGQSVREVAREYQIPVGTVKNWSASKVQPDAVTGATVKKEIGDLILDYLHKLLVTLAIQAEVFRDEEWLRKQPASEAAVLHGVLADKGIRLLEALAGENEPPDNEMDTEPGPAD